MRSFRPQALVAGEGGFEPPLHGFGDRPTGRYLTPPRINFSKSVGLAWGVEPLRAASQAAGNPFTIRQHRTVSPVQESNSPRRPYKGHPGPAHGAKFGGSGENRTRSIYLTKVAFSLLNFGAVFLVLSSDASRSFAI